MFLFPFYFIIELFFTMPFGFKLMLLLSYYLFSYILHYFKHSDIVIFGLALVIHRSKNRL